MGLKSIDTKYAGCLFRSRLEARYAVLFDALGIAWEYEPQGFEVTRRLEFGDTTFNYLPDFWLPGLEVWFEVKGELDDISATRLLNAAASLSSNDGAGCHDSGGHDLAVGGPLTSSGATGVPIRLHMHKGDLQATCLWCNNPHGRYVEVARDDGWQTPNAPTTLLRGFYCATHSADARFLTALDDARTARFEFGRNGKKKVAANVPLEVRR